MPWQQGHELAGEIADIGAGVTDLAVGQRVGIEAEHLLACGKCRAFRAGQNQLCPQVGIKDGEPQGSRGFSQYDIVQSSNCHSLPDSVSFDSAALIDCYSCAVHALNRTPVSPQSTIAIIGTGAIAMTFGQTAKLFGAGTVIMIGPRQAPLETALRVGAADEVLAASRADLAEAVMRLTKKEGVDIVVETVGGQSQILAQAMNIARPGGAVVVLGLFTSEQIINPSVGMRREVTLRWSNSFSSWNGVSEYATALKMMAAGRFDPAAIVTHHFSLERISEAFAAADDKRASGAIRVMVHP